MTTFLLAGRWLEKRAKRRAGAALRALLELGAKDVTRAPRRRRGPGPGGRAARRATCSWSGPGEKVATDGVVESGTSAVDASLLTGESVPGRGRARESRWPVRRSTSADGSSSGPPGSAPTPSWRGWPGWSRRHRTARPRCSGWPTGSRASSCPVVIALAAGDARLLARHRRRAGDGVHRGGGGADRRLPVRARPGHADRADGRHRPRCPARHPDPRPRGARGHPAHRHRRARQDRDGDHRPDDAGRRGRPLPGEDADDVRRLAGGGRGRLGAPDRPGGRRGGRRRTRRWTGFRNLEGRGVRGTVEGATCVVGRPELLADERAARARSTCGRRRARRSAAGRTAVVVGWDGRARGRARGRRHRQADLGRGGADGCAALGLEPVLLTGDNERTARAVAAEVGIDEVVAGVLPEGKVAAVRELQARGPGGGHGRRRRQRRRRPGRGRPRASPWAPAPTSRSRRPT